MTADVEKWIAKASKACGACTQESSFSDYYLNINTKHKFYQSCVMSVLLYGSECWAPLKKNMKKIDSSHNRCVRTILGISNQQQRTQHITSLDLREKWGDREDARIKVMRRRMEWLGHIVRMPKNRTPKICLFGWLPQTRLQSGPRL